MMTGFRTSAPSHFIRWFKTPLLALCLIFGACANGAEYAADDAMDADFNLASDTGLSEDGPIQLPVTIAKLDAPDTGLIVSRFLYSGITGTETETNGSGYVISGLPDAVNVEQSTKVYALNTATGVEVIVGVATDGSFELEISALATDTIAFAAMIDDESAISEPFFTNQDGDETVIFEDDEAGSIIFTSSASVSFNLSKSDSITSSRSGTSSLTTFAVLETGAVSEAQVTFSDNVSIALSPSYWDEELDAGGFALSEVYDVNSDTMTAVPLSEGFFHLTVESGTPGRMSQDFIYDEATKVAIPMSTFTKDADAKIKPASRRPGSPRK